MYFIYSIIEKIFFLISPLYFRIRIFKNKEHPTRFKEKKSITNLKRGNGKIIWFHAASVGEIKSIIPLIELVTKIKSIKKILITTNTLSSSKIVQKVFIKNKKIIHQFFPMDVKYFVKKFLNFWSPKTAIFIDSEIWPNFINQIKLKKINLLLINGRITKKSFRKWKKIISFAKTNFSQFDLNIVANKLSKNYLKKLGSKNIKYFGNLKFSDSINNKKIKISKNKYFNKKKIWCAASTHPSEEMFCGKVHKELKNKLTNLVTIIIPRHISRISKIEKELLDLKLKVKIIRKKEDIKLYSNIDVFLVNSYGETEKYFDISRSVFLGGSMLDHGGQNPIEPAKLGCRIYHGPYIYNFHEIYKDLKNYKVALPVNNEKQLINNLIKDFKNNKIKNKNISVNLNKYGKKILYNVFNEIRDYI